MLPNNHVNVLPQNPGCYFMCKNNTHLTQHFGQSILGSILGSTLGITSGSTSGSTLGITSGRLLVWEGMGHKGGQTSGQPSGQFWAGVAESQFCPEFPTQHLVCIGLPRVMPQVVAQSTAYMFFCNVLPKTSLIEGLYATLSNV